MVWPSLVNPLQIPPSEAEARLGAYLMSGSLRYALALADELEAEGPEGPGRDGAPGPPANPSAALAGRWRADLGGRPPRSLPSWAAADSVGAAGDEAAPGSWLEPFRDDLYPYPPGPAARFDPPEPVHLEFVAALQLLEPGERSLIVLHDVLGLPAEPDLGPTGLAAAREAFAAARAQLPAPGPAVSPDDQMAVMMRLLFACESGDRDGLRALLARGATFQSVPEGVALSRPEAVTGRLLAARPQAGLAGRPQAGATIPDDHHGAAARPHRAAGLQRLLPRRANGRLAFGVYRRTSRDEPFRAHAIWVVTVAGHCVTGVVCFTTPSLFPAFDLLHELEAQGERHT